MAHTLGVRVIIPYKDSIMFVEHTRKGQGSYWVLPGGGIEAGEDIFSAAQREVMEELGLEITPEKLMYIRQVQSGEHVGIEFYVLAQEVSQRPQLGYDPEKEEQVLTNVRGIRKDELSEYNWYPVALHDILAEDLDMGVDGVKDLGIDKI